MPRPRPVPPPDPRVAIAYLGPSTVPPRQQAAAIRTFCAERALKLVGEHHDDEDLPLPDRNGFIELLVEAEDKHIGSVVTYDHAVLAGTVAGYALALRAIVRAGATWLRVHPEVPWADEAVADVLGALKQHESMIYRPKVRLGMRGRAEVRARPGGPAPWGFRRDEDGQFVEEPSEQEVVREIIRRRNDGASLDELAAYVQGLQMPGRSPKIYRSTINAILKRAAS